MDEYKLYFAREAKESYEALLAQVKERWGQKTVTKFQKDTRRVLNIALKNPFAFPNIKENAQVRRALVHRTISFLYRIVADEIQIIVFFDNRQDPFL